MPGISFDAFREIDPSKKDAVWCNNMVTFIRQNSTKLTDPGTIRENKKIILSQQSMDKIKDSFKDKDFIENTKFNQLGIWNRIVNIIVEEITKNPPRAKLKATDPTALNEKKEDIELLKNKHIYENDVNAINAKIGNPPETIGLDKYHGNVEEFFNLGLDPNDPDDINFYSQNYQRLLYEIAGQSLINNVIKSNRFDKDNIRRFVLDILSCIRIAIQVYVDEQTGAIKYKYLYPETVYGIWGDSENGSDDLAHGYNTDVTVMEWLGQVGNKFNWLTDWRQLLAAVNFNSSQKYTGFVRNGIWWDCAGKDEWMAEIGCESGQPTSLLDWEVAQSFKVISGYVEFTTVEATGTYLARKDDNELVQPVDYNYQIKNKSEQTKYYKESFYQEQMYKSNYLSTSTSTQMIYKWGKVYYTQLEGAFDEYAKGTLKIYRYEGKSAAEISEPYIEFANMAFYRMKWMVYHAKPQKEQHFIPELIKLAKSLQRLYPQGANTTTLPTIDNILTQVIKYKRENFIDIRDFPEIDGKPYPVVPSTEGAKGGIDALAIGLQAITTWCEQQIAEKVGLNDMRLGQIQNAREGYKQNIAETQSSLNSTGYIYRMIQYLKETVATTTLNYSQDIIKFKDTIPYKWIRKLVGEEEFSNLKVLDKFAVHRFGLFVDDYNSQLDKQAVQQAADLALDKGDGRGGLDINQWWIIRTSEDPEKAMKLLDFLKIKLEKKKRKQELQDMQQKHANLMEEKKADADLQDKKDAAAQKRSETEKDGFVQSAQIQADSRIEVKKLSNENEPQKQDAKTQSAQRIAETKSNLEEQKALT